MIRYFFKICPAHFYTYSILLVNDCVCCSAIGHFLVTYESEDHPLMHGAD